MKIDKSNCMLINTEKVYVHDDVLLSLSFDPSVKKMILKFREYLDESQKYTIEFYNVIGFTMTSCDYWGGDSINALDFEYVDKCEEILITELQKRWRDVPESSPKASYNDFMETVVTFCSGDTLRIACETIEFTKRLDKSKFI